MIGLIMQAAGAAATMASGMVSDKDYVEKTSTYAPAGFSQAGLFNNAIGDLGQVDTYSNVTEERSLKKGLAGLGTALSSSSSFMESTFKDAKGIKGTKLGGTSPDISGLDFGDYDKGL